MRDKHFHQIDSGNFVSIFKIKCYFIIELENWICDQIYLLIEFAVYIVQQLAIILTVNTLILHLLISRYFLTQFMIEIRLYCVLFVGEHKKIKCYKSITFKIRFDQMLIMIHFKLCIQQKKKKWKQEEEETLTIMQKSCWMLKFHFILIFKWNESLSPTNDSIQIPYEENEKI